MRVLCCGPESSGTRLLTRIIATGDGIEAVHRSIPHWDSWELLPEENGHIDRAVFITRSWTPTIKSQVSRGLVRSEPQSLEHIRRAHHVFLTSIGDIPWWQVVYRNLILQPEIVLADLSMFLETKLSLPEPLYDANRQWV